VVFNNIIAYSDIVGVSRVAGLAGDDSVVSYNLFYSNPTDYIDSTMGVGNIFGQDPLFLYLPQIGPDGIWDTLDDDYDGLVLQEASPAINAGVTQYTTVSGALIPNPAISGFSGLAPDLGWQEVEDTGPTPTPSNTPTATNTATITPTSTVTNTATEGPSPTATNTASTTPTITPAMEQELIFVPSDDASLHATSPATNYGIAPNLEVDASSEKDTLLRFDVTGIGTSSVENVTLRLYNIDASDFGGNFHIVTDNTWSEDTVTWSNAPAGDGAFLGSLGPVSVGFWYELDVTPLVIGDGPVSIRISSTSSSGADYSSKENTNGFAPELIVSIKMLTSTATFTPLPTDTATFTPTNTPTFTPTNTATFTATATNTATFTPLPTDTPTDTPVPTDTATFTPTFTATMTPTNTATFTATATNTATFTPTNTATFTPTFTATMTATPTDTPTITPTFTATFTPTHTATATPSVNDAVASSEISVAGTVGGSYLLTQSNDGTSESITEQESGGKPQGRYSYLEHKWLINVAAGNVVTLHANAWSSGSSDGDVFIFAYSTDDLNYTDMFTVANTTDTGEFTFLLPPSVQGTLYIRVTDSNRVAGQQNLDTVHVDHLFVRTESIAGSAPDAPSSLNATTVSVNQIDLDWLDNAVDELGFYIERSDDGVNWAALDAVGENVTVYLDITVFPNTTYYYRVRAYNGSGESGYTNVASATTPNGIILTATGYKVKGIQNVDLSWTNVTSVDIYRDGVPIVTGVGGSSYTDNIGTNGAGSYQYQVCEASSLMNCSALVQTDF